jgi:hypothetical protein
LIDWLQRLLHAELDLEKNINPEAAPSYSVCADRILLVSSIADEQDNTQAGSRGPVLVMPPAEEPKHPHRWLQRLWLVVFVLFCLEVGIILTVLPWTRLWTDNSLLLGFPAMKEFVNYGFVRGLVSGLGLIDIWMGVVEAVTYRESSRN